MLSFASLQQTHLCFIHTQLYIVYRESIISLTYHTSTLEEAWNGRKPHVKNLKVFGSLYYTHVSKEKKKKTR